MADTPGNDVASNPAPDRAKKSLLDVFMINVFDIWFILNSQYTHLTDYHPD